jgi:2-polyprenyl-3-methyl-5-hydroxy-6-metoxy-1,4-benzoquinol methylase
MLIHGRQDIQLDVGDSVNLEEDAPMHDWRDSYMLQSEDVARYVEDPALLGKSRATRDVYPCLRNVLRAHDARSVLDVGCNAGYTYDWLQNHMGNTLQYTGIDINEKIVEEARAMHGPEVPFHTYDLFDLKDDPTHRADVVFCSRVLIHLPDLKSAIRALHAACNKALLVTVKIGPLDRLVRYNLIDRETKQPTGEFFYLRTITTQVLDSVGMRYRLHPTGEYTTVEF